MFMQLWYTVVILLQKSKKLAPPPPEFSENSKTKLGWVDETKKKTFTYVN